MRKLREHERRGRIEERERGSERMERRNEMEDRKMSRRKNGGEAKREI
jgi:hypothetical protein